MKHLPLCSVWKESVLLLPLILFTSCGSSQQFVAIPPDLERENAPHQTIEMTAEDYHFTPDVIHVKVGTLVTLKVTSTDGTHGLKLGDFGLDETIEEGQTKVVEFYAARKGEYGFKCSHFCGIGHFGMNGKLIVE